LSRRLKIAFCGRFCGSSAIDCAEQGVLSVVFIVSQEYFELDSYAAETGLNSKKSQP
jgi:hypothetical protein